MGRVTGRVPTLFHVISIIYIRNLSFGNFRHRIKIMCMKVFKKLLKKIFSHCEEEPSHGDGDRILSKELLVVHLDSSGSLSQRLGKGNLQNISRLKILGNLNSTDVGVLRSMSHLEILDLSEARIVVGGDYYIKSLYCQNENDVIGLYMFHRHTSLRSIYFPKDVRVVRAFAFRRCVALTEVHFSDALEQIEERAFSHCEALQSLCFPASLKNIRDMAFMHCKSLKSVELPSSVVKIGNYAFGDCPALVSIILSASLNEVGMEAFTQCKSLVKIHTRGKVPAFANTNSFAGIDVDRCTLFVPKGTKELYCVADGWRGFKHIVEE